MRRPGAAAVTEVGLQGANQNPQGERQILHEDQIRDYRRMAEARYRIQRQVSRVLGRPYRKTLERLMNPDQNLEDSLSRRARIVPAEVLYSSTEGTENQRVYIHRSEEEITCLDNQQVDLPLITPQSHAQLLRQNYRFIHIGAIQVRVQALHRTHAGTMVLVLNTDRRWNGDLSLFGGIEGDLTEGAFMTYIIPNVTMTVEDFCQNIMVEFQTRGYSEWVHGSNLLITRGMVGRLSNTPNVGFNYNISAVTDYLASRGVRTLPGRRYSTADLQGLRWNIRRPREVIPRHPTEMISRNLLGGGFSLSFREYQPITTEQRRAAQHPEEDSLEEEVLGVLNVEVLDWDGLDFPEPDPTLVNFEIPEPEPQQQHPEQVVEPVSDEILEFRREYSSIWDYGSEEEALLEFVYYSTTPDDSNYWSYSNAYRKLAAALEGNVSPNDVEGLEEVEGGTSTHFSGGREVVPPSEPNCCIMCNKRGIPEDKILCQNCMDITDDSDDEREVERQERKRMQKQKEKRVTPSTSKQTSQEEIIGAIEGDPWEEFEEMVERLHAQVTQQQPNPPADPQASNTRGQSAQSPYRPPEDTTMGQPSYAPARPTVETVSGPPSFRTDSRFLKRGTNNENWSLPPAQQQGGVLLTLPEQMGLLNDVFMRWETTTLNHMSLMNIQDTQEKVDYMENLLGETAKLAWIQWRTVYEDEYKAIVAQAEGRMGTQNVISQVRRILTLSDPVQGSTAIQDQAYRDLERLQCHDVKDMVKFLNDYMRLATKTGRLYIGRELSDKLWIKMPGDLGTKIKEEFDKKHPGAEIAVIPRIFFAHKYLEDRCKEAAFTRSLKSVSFCKDIPIQGYYGSDKPKYTPRKAKTYKGKPHETHVRIDRRKNLDRNSHCKCFICEEPGHYARDCPNQKRNIKRVMMFNQVNIPDNYDIVSVQENEEDSDAIYSLTEGEEGDEIAFGIVQESVHMISHQVIGSWRAHIDMSEVQKVCRHQWQDHQEIEAPGEDTCLWCKHHINIRTRSHCPACLLTTCNICSLRYLGREVPPKAQERPLPFPDQTALIQQQQLYMNWADQDRARLKQEVEDEKRRGQLLFEAERRRTERLGEEIAQQKLRIESMEEEQKLKNDLHAHTERDLQKKIKELKRLLREEKIKRRSLRNGKDVRTGSSEDDASFEEASGSEN
nr:polyprotein [Sweet potato badnavirus B]